MNAEEGEALLAAKRKLVEGVAYSIGLQYRQSTAGIQALTETYIERLRDDDFAILRTCTGLGFIQFLLAVATHEFGPPPDARAFARRIITRYVERNAITVQVTRAGVVMGSTSIVLRPQVVRSLFFPAPGFVAIESAARDVGAANASGAGTAISDEMERLMRLWTGGPLAVQDESARPISAVGVVVVGWPQPARDMATYVAYIDLRRDQGPVFARKPAKTPIAANEWNEPPT